MKAAFLNEQEIYDGLNINHRKEDKFSEQFSGIVCRDGKMYEAVILRIYRTDSRAYACLWTMGNYAWGQAESGLWRSGSGRAGGGGYHKASAAAASAVKAAGIELSESIHGAGDSAIMNAVEAIAREMWNDESCTVFVHHAHA